jgi:hypothetical protein
MVLQAVAGTGMSSCFTPRLVGVNCDRQIAFKNYFYFSQQFTTQYCCTFVIVIRILLLINR